MATASSSKTAADEKPQGDHIWLELKLLHLIVVQSRLGQTVLKLTDNFLWVVEKCAEWSLPRQGLSEDEDRKDSGKPELVRPLPWLLFLPSLVMLRMIRVTVNIGAFILGYSQVTPCDTVKFVQVCRRYLSTAMNKGVKEKHDSKDKRSSFNEAKKVLIRSIRLTLSSLSCLDTSKPSLSPPPTKIHVSSILDPDPVTTTTEEKSVTESMDSTAKLKDSDSESEAEEEKETLNEKLDRLAMDNSESDENFEPDKCCFSNASSNEDGNENTDDDISAAETREILEEAVLFVNDHLKGYVEQFLNAEKNSEVPSQCEPSKTAQPGQRSSDEESRDKVEERLVAFQRLDLPECCTPDRSSQEGEPIFYSPIGSDIDASTEPSAPVTEQSKSSGEINNGAVVQKRGANAGKCHKGKRTSHGNRKKK
ncbi:hypothetical protein PUN28_018756 [Cardiocondyla obscurior]|uniref:Uncharacterized protein n=1 Tax=Cardiocondyla obscurior TaxID=286306 RepID=A0AAW2EDV5_9HYME